MEALDEALATADAGRLLVLQLLDDGPGVTLDELVARPTWMRDAACAGQDLVDVFFPDRGCSADAARAVCTGCLVLEECRSWALAQGEGLRGVWGGLSESQRRLALRPAPVRAARLAGTCAVCGFADEVEGTPDGLLDGKCHRAWIAKRRPTGPGFEAWAADRRTFLALAG